MGIHSFWYEPMMTPEQVLRSFLKISLRADNKYKVVFRLPYNGRSDWGEMGLLSGYNYEETTKLVDTFIEDCLVKLSEYGKTI